MVEVVVLDITLLILLEQMAVVEAEENTPEELVPLPRILWLVLQVMVLEVVLARPALSTNDTQGLLKAGAVSRTRYVSYPVSSK